MQKIAFSVALGAATALSGMPALAQTAAPVPTVPPTSGTTEPAQDTSTSGLADIVVTAQRRSENLQKVPIAVTAVTSEQFVARGIGSTIDLNKVTPGLVFGNAGGLIKPSLRGVTTTSQGAGIENSIATYVDGVYIASIPGSLLALEGVERIEVLRGPQGTLFGRNATGGLIQVVTRDPGSRPEGTVSLTYGNYQTLTGSGYLAGPLSDTLGASIAFTGTHQGDGYGTNLTTGHDVYKTDHDIALRGKVVFTPSADTKIRLSGDYSDVKSSMPAFGGLTSRPAFYGPIRKGNSVWNVDSDIDPIHTLSSGGGSLRIDQRIGTLNLVSITAYRRMNFRALYDFDTTPTPAVTIDYVNRDRTISQEVQLQSSDKPVKWVLGGYYYDASSRYAPYIQRRGAPLAVGSTVINSEVTDLSLAGFGQASYELSSGTTFTAGLRYTSEKRGVSGTGVILNAAGVVTGNAFVAPDADKRFKKLTWRLAVAQDLGGNSLLYASYNRGFKAGSFNGQAPQLPAFDPEVLDAYEVGLKTDLLDRHLRVNLAGFYYDYKNIQITTFVNGTSQIYNGAKARQYGLDLEVTAAITPRFTISGNLEAIHDRFVDFPAAVISRPQPNGTNIQTPGSANGNRLPYTADLTASIAAHYQIPLGAGSLAFNADYTYNDGFFTEPDNVLRQPSNNLVGAAVIWKTGKGFSLSGWVKNLANEKVVGFLSTTPSSVFVTYNPPRTYGATATYAF